ncbi:MAG: HTTM domain-containing protein [Planctomycetes bacterium]|nr:HTTM domain-containing protein [Planctomycetota bacterium]
MERLRRLLAAPIPAASLAFFRIAFGAILLWEVTRFFSAGWIEAHYVAPPFHFRYFGFEWVERPSLEGLQALFAALGVLAALIAVGWWTRTAAALFFVGFGWVFLLEQARYLNHFYLVLLLLLLLAWVPTDGEWSLRAALRGRRPAPSLALFLLRAQLLIVYGYAALAKVNGDWLQGEPLRQWLKGRGELPLIGPLLLHPATPWFMSWSGLLLDLLAVPLLCWRRTRVAMFAALCCFHLLNACLFDIGIFPWMAIAATTLFFAPDWPSRWLARWRGGWQRQEQAEARALFGYDSGVFQALARREGETTVERPLAAFATAAPPRLARATLALVALWLAYQLLFPLRHFLYPGNVSWTEEGHLFAWHMKLRSKTSSAHFVVTDPVTGERRIVDPRAELADWQAQKMGDRPEMVLQYAHHLARRYTVVDPATGAARRPQVRAIVDCSLNGRDAQPLIDPNVDLAAVERSLAPAPWIVPLTEPLPPEWRRGQVEFEE